MLWMIDANAFVQGFMDARIRSGSRTEFGFTGFTTKLPAILDSTSYYTCTYCGRTNSIFRLEPRCNGCGASKYASSTNLSR